MQAGPLDLFLVDCFLLNWKSRKPRDLGRLEVQRVLPAMEVLARPELGCWLEER